MQSITHHLGLTFRKPVNYIACRWLSVYVSSIDFDYAFDAYYIYFLLYEKTRINVEIAKISKTKENSSKTMKELEQEAHRVDKKLDKKLNNNNVSASSRQELQKIENRFVDKWKSCTSKGRDRKLRIIPKLLYGEKRYQLCVGFYQSVLPIFKEYVMVFQSDTPRFIKFTSLNSTW